MCPDIRRGVQNVVRFGGRPIVIDDLVIELIRAQVDEKGFVRMDDLRPGDKVIIKGGPFKNLTGIFNSALNDDERVSVFLTAVSYQNHVIVEKDLVVKDDLPAM